MRRVVLIVLMLLLPLQWSWAAAAAVCAHESGNAHFGHHEHRHVDPHAGHAAADLGDPAGTAVQDAAQDAVGDPAGTHPDCHTCHGPGVACIAGPDATTPAWAAQAPPRAPRVVLPEPPVATLLRPPLAAAAPRG